jgi:hypothetical protein
MRRHAGLIERVREAERAHRTGGDPPPADGVVIEDDDL